ncbi:MAG: 30S ribosome-binding factor RbfA [Peptostreptococcaceae bacterium]|nr:30S ribosome-binding factor RbfA [Peptostreptococcaceae bacterium]
MGKNHRVGRLGEEIRKIVSGLLINGVKDPRLSGIISISSVVVTADYSFATCYVMPLLTGSENKEEEEQEILAGLYSAKGVFRKEIGRSIKMRHVPELIFKFDHSMEYGRHIDEIIDSLDIKKDEEDTDEEK